MKKKELNFQKDSFRCLAAELSKIAAELLKSGAVSIPMGTYTAADIHRYINKVCPSYHTKNRIWWPILNVNCPVDVRSIREVTCALGTLSFPWIKVFYLLWKCEIKAGLRGKKAHRFTGRERRQPFSESSITFEGEKSMKRLSKLVFQLNESKQRFCYLSLSDGCISGKLTGIGTLEEPGSFILEPTDYSHVSMLRNLSFRIEASQLQYLYGECKLSLYKSEEFTGPTTNPYDIRIMIENPDGWIISSDIIERTVQDNSPIWGEVIDDTVQETVPNINKREENEGLIRIESTERESVPDCADENPTMETELEECYNEYALIQSLPCVGINSSNECRISFRRDSPVPKNTDIRCPILQQECLISESRRCLQRSDRSFPYGDTYIEHSVKNLLKSRPDDE